MTTFVRVSGDIRLNLELNQSIILVLLDFYKVSNNLFHGLFILNQRQRYSFRSWTAVFISSYIFPRHQRVGCGDDFFFIDPLVAGVPQRSPILPLCFSQEVKHCVFFIWKM
jgi:hypothetical protein